MFNKRFFSALILFFTLALATILLTRPLYFALFIFLFLIYLLFEKKFFKHLEKPESIILIFYLFFLEFYQFFLVDLWDYHYDFVFLEKLKFVELKQLFNPGWSQFFLLLLLFLAIFKLLSQKKRAPWSKKKSLVFISSILMLLIYLSAQYFAPYSYKFNYAFWNNLLLYFTFPILLIFFDLYRHKKSELLAVLLAFFCFALLGQSLLALGQFVKGGELGIALEHGFTNIDVVAPELNIFRSSGSFPHPNYLANHLSLLLLLLTAFFYQHQDKKRPKLVFILSLILGSLALVLSSSRWATFSFLLTLFFLLGKQLKLDLGKSKNSLKYVYYLSIFFLLITLIWRLRLLSTWSSRVEIFKIYWQLIQNHWLWGLGVAGATHDLNAYRFNYWLYESSLKGAHNTFFLIWADSGWLFVTSFVFFSLLSLIFLVQKYREKKNNLVIKSFPLLIILFILNALFYPLYYYDNSLALFFVLIAFFISYNDL